MVVLARRINEKLGDDEKWVITDSDRRLRFDPKTVGTDTVFLKETRDLEILERRALLCC